MSRMQPIHHALLRQKMIAVYGNRQNNAQRDTTREILDGFHALQLDTSP